MSETFQCDYEFKDFEDYLIHNYYHAHIQRISGSGLYFVSFLSLKILNLSYLVNKNLVKKINFKPD